MANQKITDYTFTPSTGRVTLNSLPSVDLKRLVSIKNVTRGTTYFFPQDARNASVDGNTVILPRGYVGLSDKSTDELSILYSDPVVVPGAGLTEAEVEAVVADKGGVLFAPNPQATKNPLTGWFHADGFGYDPTGATSSSTAITAAMTAAKNDGGGTVYVPDGNLRLDTSLRPRNRVTVRSNPGGVVVTSPNNIHAFIDPQENVELFVVDGLEFRGTRPVATQLPSRGNVVIGGIPAGLRSGGMIRAKLDPTGAAFDLKHVIYRNCRFVNTGSLPVHLSGVGVGQMTDCYFENTLDPGYTYTPTVKHSGCMSVNGGDNGVSVSRGCTNVTVVDCTSLRSAYYGFWIAGYVNTDLGIGDPGPEAITFTGNLAVGCGQGGLGLRDAPKYGTISGNTFDTMVRGPVDAPDETQGNGIHITGYPYTPVPAPTSLATGLLITGNTFRKCERGGIAIRGASNVKIIGNLFLDIGVPKFLNDTAITATDQSYNCGIYSADPASVSNVQIEMNTFIETRTPASTNYAIAPNLVSLASVKRSGNTSIGLRQPLAPEPVRVSGAAGTTRELSLRTDNGERFTVVLTGDAETGTGNAGSNLEIRRYSDAGALLSTPIKITRSNGEIRLNNQVVFAGGADLGNDVTLGLGTGNGTKIGYTASKIGFFGVAPVAKPALTYSKATETPAEAGIRTALVALGLVTDSTVA